MADEPHVPHPTDHAEAPATPPASPFEDLVDIFHAPSAVFARRRDGRFVVALLVLAVVLGILAWLGTVYLAPMYDAMMQKGIAAAARSNPQLTAEQLERGRLMQERFAPLLAVGGALAGAVVGALVTGLLVWAAGKLVAATMSFRLAFVVAVYAAYPTLVDQALRVAQGALLDANRFTTPYSVSLSLARLLDPQTTPALALGLASRVDVFVIWSAILIAIGIHVAGRVPRARAYLAAGIVWFFLSLFPVWGAVRQAGA